MRKFTAKNCCYSSVETRTYPLSMLLVSVLLLLLAACSGKIDDREVPSIKPVISDTLVEPEDKAGKVATRTDVPTEAVDIQLGGDRSVAIDTPQLQEQALQQDVSINVVDRSSASAAEQVLITGNPVRSSEGFLAAPPQPLFVRSEPNSPDYYSGPHSDRENYLDVVENAIKKVSEEPLSTFSIDVDTAAYSNIRRMLASEGRLPPHDAVRIEEMINYFDYNYAAPESLDSPLAVHTELMAAPWNAGNQLLMVGIKGFEPKADERPNANLVFLVDVSGSMQSPDKLGLVKRSLQLLVSQMRDEDRIALVVYAGAAGMVLDSTSAREKAKINNALEALTAGGSTNGAAGIELAYSIAEQNMIEGGINRVIIASDGDLNVGVTSIDDLIELIGKKRDNGVALTSLGFGSGNYNYSLMEQIADAGNGNAAYIDTLSEARKVLVEEMQSTLLTIAKDVKIQVEFNPAVVSEYRLLGYENRVLNREDFRNDKVDAGEIGAGHTVTALYEISLKGSGSRMIPDRRYSERSETDVDFSNELAYVNIRYKMPQQDNGNEFGVPVNYTDVSEAGSPGSENIRFAAAVAGFGQLLRGGKYTRDWNYDELLQLIRQARGDDEHGYRNELVKLVELARLL